LSRVRAGVDGGVDVRPWYPLAEAKACKVASTGINGLLIKLLLLLS
jgi:hypothetical protein